MNGAERYLLTKIDRIAMRLILRVGRIHHEAIDPKPLDEAFELRGEYDAAKDDLGSIQRMAQAMLEDD